MMKSKYVHAMYLIPALAIALVVTNALTTGSALAQQGRTHEIKITSSSFPLQTKIKVGDSIVWINNHDEDHTATAKLPEGDPRYFNTDTIATGGGRSKPQQFNLEGGVVYYCKVHGMGMWGTIIVER